MAWLVAHLRMPHDSPPLFETRPSMRQASTEAALLQQLKPLAEKRTIKMVQSRRNAIGMLLISTMMPTGNAFSISSQRQASAIARSRSGSTQRRMSDEHIHSFVEGENFNDRMSEIEAMGGDPFFMTDDDDDDNDASTKQELSVQDFAMPSASLMASMGGDTVMDLIAQREGNADSKKKYFPTDGQGPAPKMPQFAEPQNEAAGKDGGDSGWEWDGTVNEEAHFDEF